jgi:hypothetical protein
MNKDFWDINCHWVSKSQCFKGPQCLCLQGPTVLKAPKPFKISQTTHPMTKCHNSEKWNLQKTPLWVPKILTQQQHSLWCRYPIVPSMNLFTVHVYGAVHLDVFLYNLDSMCCTTPLRSLFCRQNSFHWYKYWQNASSKLQSTDTEQRVRIACIHVYVCVCVCVHVLQFSQRNRTSYELHIYTWRTLWTC